MKTNCICIGQAGRLLLAVCGLLLFGSCELDKGLGPLESKISGKIYYIGTELRPGNVDEVRVAALTNFPPTSLAEIVFSEPLDYQVDSTEYELPLPEGEYVAVVLLWKPKGEEWAFQSLLGVYGLNPFEGEVALEPVTIAHDGDVHLDVNLWGLWLYAGSDADVKGTYTLFGDAPDDTEAVLLAAFTRVPQLDNFSFSILFLGGLPLPISPTATPKNYTLRVANGDYEFVGIFWKGTQTPLEEMKLIGYYRAEDGSPGSFSLEENGEVQDIDFAADYGALPDGLPQP